MKIELTKAELEAVRWAVGNFEMGDASDCDGKARHKAMRTAYAKLNKVFQTATAQSGRRLMA
jgi:hypothetical protein